MTNVVNLQLFKQRTVQIKRKYNYKVPFDISLLNNQCEITQKPWLRRISATFSSRATGSALLRLESQ